MTASANVLIAVPARLRVIHLRPAILARDDAAAAALVLMTRPRGYFGPGRDAVMLAGAALAAVTPGVPAVSLSRLRLTDAVPRSVVARCNDETIVARIWPLAERHVTIAEFHY